MAAGSTEIVEAEAKPVGEEVAPRLPASTPDEHAEEESLLHPLPRIESKRVRLGLKDDTLLGNAGFILGEPEKPDWTLVPPDGGWGWLVLMGAMVVNILIPGTIKSFGVLFVEFLEVFKATPATAAWIPALCYFLYSSLGPLSSILSVKYSYRTVTLIGGTFAATGMILSCWASSVTYLYISYGVLVGTGAGLAFPPTIYIVTSYFVRLRGLANGLCMSGSALGSIILPPVLRFLLETYGYRGAILIMGGVTLHVWVAATFFHPVEEHMKRVPVEYDDDGDSQNNDIFCEEDLTLDTYEDLSDPSTKSPMENGLAAGPQIAVTSGDSSSPSPARERVPSLSKKESVKERIPNGGSPLSGDGVDSKDHANFVRSSSAAVVQSSRNVEADHQRRRKVSMPARNSRSNMNYNPSFALSSVPEGQLGSSQALSPHIRRIGSVNRTPKRSASTSSFQYMSTPFHGSTLSAFQQPDEFASQLTLQSIKESFRPMRSCLCCCCKSKQSEKLDKPKERSKFFDVTLLKDPIYLVILISNCTNAISYTNFIILLPSYAINLGFDKSLAAYLLSIVSALDLCGRIGGSALSDTGLIPKPYYFVGGLFFSGLSLALVPFFAAYSTISACCGVFGLASGVYVGVTAIIMAEMLGTERLTSTYGISLFVNGILQLIGPPICGVWFERTGSYSTLFVTLGTITMCGAAIWSVMPYLRRRKARIEREGNAAAAQGGLGKV